MIIKKATQDDLSAVWKIRLEASMLLRKRRIDQWQYEDPSYPVFEEDLRLGALYVGLIDDEIIACMALREGEEETYTNIYDGAWHHHKPYLTIHRLAIKRSFLGRDIAKKMIEKADEVARSKGIDYMRIDTHADNRYAIKLFESAGYSYCGWILLNIKKGDLKRNAYDKIIGG